MSETVLSKIGLILWYGRYEGANILNKLVTIIILVSNSRTNQIQPGPNSPKILTYYNWLTAGHLLPRSVPINMSA